MGLNGGIDSKDRRSMKIILILISFYISAFSQIIVDHRAVQEFEQIPTEWIEKARQLTVHYGHTSHGSQILAGLYWLQNNVDNVKYKVAIAPRNGSRTPVLPSASNSLLMWEEGLWPATTSSRLGYWEGAAAFNATQNIISSGMFDVSGWSWCGEVSNNGFSYIQSYLDAMSRFNMGDVKLFYMTGHHVATGPPNHQQVAWQRLHDNNQGIKDHVIATKGILFDFADLEDHDPEGNYYPQEDGTGLWCAAYVSNHPGEYPNLPPMSGGGCGVNCSTSAHAHGLFTVLKAKAFWWMLAKIAGWEGEDPPPTTVLAPVNLRVK